jgi:hypothetical protein
MVAFEFGVVKRITVIYSSLCRKDVAEFKVLATSEIRMVIAARFRLEAKSIVLKEEKTLVCLDVDFNLLEDGATYHVLGRACGMCTLV